MGGDPRRLRGQIDSLVELLQGNFSKGVMERLCRQDDRAVPEAVRDPLRLQLPGLRVDVQACGGGVVRRRRAARSQPELLFRLRGVNETELVGQIDVALPMSPRGTGADKLLQADDVSALFGLDMAEPAVAAPPPVKAKSTRPRRTAPTTPAPQPAGTPIDKRSSLRGTRANERPLGRKPAPAKTKT